MSYDVSLRFRQALDPSTLTTLAGGLNALVQAIDECQRNRADPERDPAVLLLAQHLGDIAVENRPSQAELRRVCIKAVGAVERTPLLVTLARRGVSYDNDAKEAFHREGRKAMTRLATALGLQRDQFQVRSNMAGIAVSGEIILHAAEVYIQLDLGCMGAGYEVMFRSCAGRKDYVGGRNHFASIEELIEPARLAERIRRELQLPQSDAAVTQLIA
jgi:hypothetical protein